MAVQRRGISRMTSSFNSLLRSTLVALAAAASSAFSQAPVPPSFNCARAASPREHTVCTSPKLSTADASVSTAYLTLLKRLTPASALLIRADQRQWLHWLDLVCPANSHAPSTGSIAGCLQSEYATRLTQLQPSPSFPLLYTRAAFGYAPASATQKADDASASPGFGTGNFSWQQFDNPTPQQAAWNHAIAAAVLLNAGDGKIPPKNLNASVDPEGTIDLTASILAANDTLILAEIVNSTYGYGAAHPNTGIAYFTWLLQPARELKPEDIFRNGSNWQNALIQPLIAKLQAAGTGGSFPTPEEFHKAVATELANPRAWEPTRAGLTINFGQYEIASYAEGMPDPELPWSLLKPYLNPTFDPATLPILTPGKH